MTPQEETRAQYRFLIINICRITGAVLLVIGLAAIAREAFGISKAVGYAMFLFGLADFLLAPYFLSKRWKSSPKP
jgi:hypothetical protein